MYNINNMTGDGSSEVPQQQDAKAAFLVNHERDIADFLSVVHGQLDHATTERANDGLLWQPANDINILASKWQAATPPNLPPKIVEFLPFGKDTPVNMNARYLYG